MTRLVAEILGSAGEMQARDVHEAVEVLLGEPVSPSSVKNCLARYCAGETPTFQRVARGNYRLAADVVAP